jgi:hypothetical protein
MAGDGGKDIIHFECQQSSPQRQVRFAPIRTCQHLAHAIDKALAC